MGRSEKTFAFTTLSDSRLISVLISAMMFVLAFLFLLGGDSLSLLDDPGQKTPLSQIYSRNLTGAFVSSVVGFLGVISIFRNRDRPNIITLSENAISSPNQGFLPRYIEIRLSDIRRIQKLSIDGEWELNIEADDQKIRIAKKSLINHNDFETLIEDLQKRLPHCFLEVESKIHSPRMD